MDLPVGYQVKTERYSTRARKPSRKGSMADVPQDILTEISNLERLFIVDTDKLKEITEQFVVELKEGLEEDGKGNIPMNPSWVMNYPDGNEEGRFLALDMGGTNLRVCEITLIDEKGEFDILQSKYRIPEELKTGTAEELWEYIADCIEQFLDYHHEDEKDDLETLPLGFTFSYPAAQEYIDNGVLQRWTKGWAVEGVEGEDVVPQLEKAIKERKLPVTIAALVNDTVGTLIASAYTDDQMQIGCIFGTGCNGAYVDKCGNIPKLKHMNLDPEMEMCINCEYGAFNSKGDNPVLPRTPYDVMIDESSPRPGQQLFEKMVAGLYLGELFRLAIVDLHENKKIIFVNQDISKFEKPYSIDASLLSAIEEDPFENLSETQDLFSNHFGIHASRSELELCRRLAELIGTRAARLAACGVAAICKMRDFKTCHVGADGSVFNKYPHFKQRNAKAMREILGWTERKDPVVLSSSEDGSGVGAALIAALTVKRIKDGNTAGIKDVKKFGFESKMSVPQEHGGHGHATGDVKNEVKDKPSGGRD